MAMMRICLALTLLLASAATAAPRHHHRAVARTPDLLTASSQTIARNERSSATSPYLLTAVSLPDTGPHGPELKFKGTRVRLRVPIG